MPLRQACASFCTLLRHLEIAWSSSAVTIKPALLILGLPVSSVGCTSDLELRGVGLGKLPGILSASSSVPFAALEPEVRREPSDLRLTMVGCSRLRMNGGEQGCKDARSGGVLIAIARSHRHQLALMVWGRQMHPIDGNLMNVRDRWNRRPYQRTQGAQPV